MSTQVMLTIPDDMYQLAQQIARVRRRRVDEVLVDAIDLADERIDLDENGNSESAVDREEKAFRQLHPILREKYLGQYVAIYNGELIDHDIDQVALYLRVKDRLPGKFVWIAPVREQPIEEYVIRSPRMAGKN